MIASEGEWIRLSDPKITNVRALDLRFPTSRHQIGSDAVNTDPDYSAAYCILETDVGVEGYGLAFTLGHGTELCVLALEYLARFVQGRNLSSLTDDTVAFSRQLTEDTQFRWLGPEKGVIHLAAAALINAIWDLYARTEGKPLWKLLADFEPEQIVRSIDFKYIEDAITPGEALDLIKARTASQAGRLKDLEQHGYPAYTTSAGWFGFSDDKIRRLCRESLSQGWTHFKLKVGGNPADDLRRARMMRAEIGPHNKLMMDANQKWGVIEAIQRTKELAEVDLAVLLMAAKFNIPVCPHAGGVGLCECVQHLAIFDYLRVSASLENRVIEFVDHLHEHFADPARIANGHYLLPRKPGYSTEILPGTLLAYQYPNGPMWNDHRISVLT